MCRYKKDMMEGTMNKVDELVNAIAIVDKRIDSIDTDSLQKDINDLKDENSALKVHIELCNKRLDLICNVIKDLQKSNNALEDSKNRIAGLAALMVVGAYAAFCFVIGILRYIISCF